MPYANTEILIEAPIELVWAVMLDVGHYREWNPFVTDVDSPSAQPAIGDDLILHVCFGNGKRLKTRERITRLDSPAPRPDGKLQAALAYEFLGPVASLGMVRGGRNQYLSSDGGNLTVYHTDETLTGWLAWAAPMTQVQDGFERHAAALKQRCEKLSRVVAP